MVRINDLRFTLRAFLKTYRWRKVSPLPAAPLTRALSECRVALVSSAGLVLPGDTPFDEGVRGGDPSYRIIPADASVSGLEEHHRSDAFDHSGIAADRNCGLPLDRLHELAAEGYIKAVAPRHVSVMGSLTATGRFVRDTCPEVADLLVSDHVDVALMVPV
jgi:D-proline reductase (dithiol) PrdB